MAIGKKTGGRQKGTPNKITALAKGMIEKWLETHNTIPEGDVMPLIMQDFMELDPKDRVKVSTEFIKIIMPKNISIDDGEVNSPLRTSLPNLPEKKTRKNNLLPSTLDCLHVSREPQPEKGAILLICFEAMFERMSLFSCPDRKISSEERVFLRKK